MINSLVEQSWDIMFLTTLLFALIVLLGLITKRERGTDQARSPGRAPLGPDRNASEQVISSVTDAVIALDKERRIVIFNPAAEKLIGFPARNVINNRVDYVFKLFDGTGEIHSAHYAPLSSGEMYKNHGMRLTTHDGEAYVDVVASAVPAEFESDLGCILTLRDITRERKLEKLKTDFVAIAAHQLRTPLTGIKWTFNLALEGSLGKLTIKQKSYMKKGLHMTDTLISIINDMLDLDILETGRAEFVREPVGLRRLVQELLPNIETHAREHEVNIAFTQHREYVADLDPKQTKVAIQNLLDNAIKYTPQGGSVTIAMRLDGQNVVISVADTGIGIPPEDQEYIFQRFFRAKNAILRETAGSGLGLYLVKTIVERQGGRIWFESTEGEGTTFFVMFPIISIGKREPETTERSTVKKSPRSKHSESSEFLHDA